MVCFSQERIKEQGNICSVVPGDQNPVKSTPQGEITQIRFIENRFLPSSPSFPETHPIQPFLSVFLLSSACSLHLKLSGKPVQLNVKQIGTGFI